MKTKLVLILSACLLIAASACKSGDKGWHAKHAKKRKGVNSRQK
jgi:hypothetical protein